MRGRRRLSVVAAVALAAIPAVVLVVGLLVGDRERMVAYFEIATVGGEPSTRVEEVIDYDFGAASERHGIYRVIPGLIDPASVTVSSPTAPDDVEITGGRVRVGHPDKTISGSHRYSIGYELGTLVVGDELAWNIVGGEWDVEIETVEAHVLSDRELLDPECDQGSYGARGGCTAERVEPGHLVVRTGPVPAGDAVTLYATLGEPVASRPSAPAVPAPAPDTGAPLLMPLAFGWLLAAAAALVTGRVLRRLGREHAPAGYQGAAPGSPAVPGMDVPGLDVAGAGVPGAESPRVDVDELLEDAPPRVAPPRRLTPAQGGVVLAEKVRSEHQAAWLIGQAQSGAVALEGEAKSPTLRWLGAPGASENAPLVTMFAGRTSVELGKYDPSFSSGWKMIAAELEAWRTSSGLWSEVGERRRKIAIGVGVVLLGLGAGLAFLVGWQLSLSQPAVATLAAACIPFGVAVGLVLRAWELRIRTPEGSARYVEVETFRRYLADAEAADAERAAEAGLLHEHLAWAVALGESKAWTKAVERSSVEPGRHTYDPAFLYIAASLPSSTSSTATQPSSSGGGGGGAGGGGGGGGGGSW